MKYDCIIIGGGIAGLQAAIQLGRYQHQILVIDNHKGRSSLCKEYHNILGYPNGISGDKLRKIGKSQAEQLGVEFQFETALHVEKKDKFFIVTTANQSTYIGKRLLLATGISEQIPDLEGIYSCLGKSIYLCPDCDGYEVRNQKTVVIGTGNKGASITKTLSYWTKNYDSSPITDHYDQYLKKNHIPYYTAQVTKLHIESESQLTGITLESGEFISTNHAFLAMSGTKVETDLAKQLNVERMENEHIIVNPRTKETNIKHVYAVGDITVHSQLLTVAMGEGAQAAIWIHKSLLKEDECP